ncbi:unnamed protein product [Spirodela intermedia]|uniref:Antimicrobial peptide 1 n=1 Tax=Spirodela intermedia TaxID=51605 RepID=A0ABN7EAZ3_SPIIN|nr:unnamed protein product [Spirodela intermedia]
MATTARTPTAAAAAVLVLLIAAAVVAPASASTLTAFSGPGCAGKTKDVNGCGCFPLTGYQGGYHFVFTEGQKARLYTGSHCRAPPPSSKRRPATAPITVTRASA